MLSTTGALAGVGSTGLISDSMQKRKRDESSESRDMFRPKLSHTRRLHSVAATSPTSLRLTTQGHLLAVSDAGLAMYWNLVTASLPVQVPLEGEIDAVELCAITSLKDITYVCSCTSHGYLNIFSLELGATTVHKAPLQIELQHANEAVNSISSTGSFVILSTNYNNVYVVQRIGGRHPTQLTVCRLTPKPNLISGLIQTGFKLLGISSNVMLQESMQIFKLIPVPNSSLLFTCGAALHLWSDWNAGREDLLWQFNLLRLLEQDVESACKISAQGFQLHDVYLLPASMSLSSAIILVLTSCLSADNKNKSTRHLFLHILSAELLKTATPIEIKASLLLDSIISLPSDRPNGRAARELHPRIHTPESALGEPPNKWRVTVSWQSSVTHTLCAATYDVSLLTTAMMLLDLSDIAFEHDTELKGSDVSTITAVSGQGGLQVLSSECFLRTVFPVEFDFHAKIKQLKAAAQHSTDSDPSDMLLQICKGEIKPTEGAFSHLRRRAQLLSTADITGIVTAISQGIVDRDPLRLHWAEEGTDRIQSFKLAHRQVKGKLSEHSLLYVAALQMNKDCVSKVCLVNHQLLGLSAGLSEIIGDVASRNNSSNASAATSSTMQSYLVEGSELQLNASAVSLYDTNTTNGSQQDSDTSLFESLLLGHGKPLSGPNDVISERAEEPSEGMLPLSHRLTMRLVEHGMWVFVRDVLDLTEQQVRARGLSVTDVFFGRTAAVTEGLAGLTRALVSAKDRQMSPRATLSFATDKLHQPVDIGSKGINLFAAAFGMAFLFAKALRDVSHEGYPGADSASTAVVCTSELRGGVLSIFSCLDSAVATMLTEAKPKESVHALFKSFKFRAGKEELTVRELAGLILDGFALEISENNLHKSLQVSQLEIDFEAAKRICILPLLKMGYVRVSFHLSVKYMYFHGLMETWACSVGDDRELITRELHALLQSRGGELSTAVRTSGQMKIAWSEYCLQSLWERRLLAQILETSSFIENTVVDKFLEDKPSLSWVRALRKRDVSSAAISALAHARSMSGEASSKTVLSIAKLAARASKQVDVQAQCDRELLAVEARSELNRLRGPVSTQTPLSQLDRGALVSDLTSLINESPVLAADKERVLRLAYVCVRLLRDNDSSPGSTLELSADLWEAIVAADRTRWSSPVDSEGIDEAQLDRLLHESLLLRLLLLADDGNKTDGMILPGQSAALTEALMHRLELKRAMEPRSIRLVAACFDLATTGNRI